MFLGGVCHGEAASFWVRIPVGLRFGCMVDPNVFKYCGIDSEKHTGFALTGVERVAALRYDVHLWQSESSLRQF